LDSSEPTEPKGGGPGKNSAEAIALEAWAAPFGTDPKFMGYGFWAREACEHYPAEWVRLALEDHVVGRSARPYIGKLTAVLLRYAEQGHPDRKPGRRVAAVTPKPAPQLIRAPAGFQSGNPVNALPSAPSEVDPSNVFTQIARRTDTASPRKPQ
jgi:hypothetical protein